MSETQPSPSDRSIRVFPSPAGMETLDPREHFWIVIDVLRASTTIAYALEAGARGVIPVESVEEATRLFGTLDKETTLLGGERGSVRIEGFHLGNSPAEFRPDVVEGKTVVLTTTNGARAMAALPLAKACGTAAFVNLSACARALADEPRVAIVCAGSAGRFALEDFLCAGMLVERLAAGSRHLHLDDGARTARKTADGHSGDLLETLRSTDHGRNLSELGFERDLALACAVDRFSTIPVLRDGRVVAEPVPAGVPPR